MTRNLKCALEYASYGWKVFPLRPNQKIPATVNGFKDATDNAECIKQWWTENPTAGIGIATGTPSGLIVMDVDPRNGGTETLAAYKAQYGGWPVTPEAITGGDGRHIYFKHPGGVLPSAKLPNGIDIKAEGGYVVACPSIHPSGKAYMWSFSTDQENIEPQPTPEWLIKILKERKTKLLQEVEPQTGKTSFKEGGRNDALASLAGTMQRRGMSYDAILAAILAENMSKCRPSLSENEVAQIVTSVSRYAPDESSVPAQTYTIEIPRISFMDISGAIDEEPASVEWLIDGWLAKGDCAIISGDPGAGKSWLTLDLGLSGAANIPIWDYFPHDTFRTLIIDEENPQDEVQRRIHAIGLARGIKASHIENRLTITKPRQGLTLRRDADRRSIAKLIEEQKPDLIVLDSIIAISTIDNEADSVEVRRFFHEILGPLQNICNSTILCIHHTNKQSYSKDRLVTDAGLVRGSIDFTAAVDSAILLDGQEKRGFAMLSSLKPRRGTKPTTLQIKIMDTASGGVHPVVVNGVIHPDPKSSWDFILLCLNGGQWVSELYKKVFAASNGTVSRGAFDIALMRLVKSGQVDKQATDPTNRFSPHLYRLLTPPTYN